MELAVSLVRGKGKRLNEKKRRIQEEEKALLVFLEELRERERRTAIRQVMEKKKEGQPEDRGMQERKRETGVMKMGKHLPGNTFARLFWCIFHMSRGMKRAKDDRGKRRRKSGGAERKEHLYCIKAPVGMQSQTDWQHNGLPAPRWKAMVGAKHGKSRKLTRCWNTAPWLINPETSTFFSYVEHFYSFVLRPTFVARAPPPLCAHTHTHPEADHALTTLRRGVHDCVCHKLLTVRHRVVASANVGLHEA